MYSHSVRRITWGASTLAVLSAAPAFAQQQLPPIVVTTPTVSGATLEKPPVVKPAAPAQPASAPAPAKAATKTPSASSVPTTPAGPPAGEAGSVSSGAPEITAGVSTDTIGSPVTVVTAADLQRQQTRHVVDALRALPGVQVSSSGSVGSLTQIRLRGAEGRHTRVMIDGIEANTTKDAEFDFSNLLADDIERIEIIRGPMSALFGAGALGGTINIITKRAGGPPTATIRVEGGSFGTKDIAARVAGGNANGYLAASAQWRETGGINISPFGNENDGTRVGNFAIAGGIKLSPTARLDMTLRHTNKKAEYDGFGDNLFRAPFLTADDALNTLRDKTTLAGATLAWDALGGALTQEVKGTYSASSARNRSETLLGFAPGTVNNTLDEGTRLTAGYAATYRMTAPAIGLRHAITGLVETKRETYTPFSDYDTFFGDYNGDGRERRQGQTGVGAEWRGTFYDRLTVTAGARHDFNDSFVDATTWRASVSYAARELGLRPHASFGRGVKQPGMYDLYGPNSSTYQPNPNVKSESSLGGDVGLEWTTWGGRAVIDVTYFQHNLTDRIVGSGVDPVTFRSFVTNDTGESLRRGVEISGRFALSPAISLGLAYTYTDAERANGLAEYRRAPHAGRADVKYVSLGGRLTAGLAVAYNGTLIDKAWTTFYAGSADLKLAPSWLVSATAAYKLQPNLELFGRIENALDQKYQEIYGYNTPGIAAYVGMKVTFGPGAVTTAGR